jgi:tRNA dimethylallyltransferase
VLACLDDTGAVVGELAEAREQTVRATRRFVRRQRSWFRRDPRIAWLAGTDGALLDRALAMVPPTL